MRPVVTLSGSYGAGGSVVGPALAERLQVPFLDRIIPATVAAGMRLSVDEALERDETAPRGLTRLLAAFARVPAGPLGPVEPGGVTEEHTEQDFVEQTEAAIRRMAGSGQGAVLLGRAAAVVLADMPGALHVRLAGTEAARLRQAVDAEGVGEEQARRTMKRTDGARRAYVRTFYGRDPDDVSLYHLVVDSTRMPLPAVVELLATAATQAASAG